MNRRLLLITIAGLAALPPSAGAQDTALYPVKSIRVIVPSTPGSPPDVVGRLIGEKLTAALGKPLVFDNRPGATGIIGLEALARTPADGYTLGVMSMPFVVNANLMAKMPYDTEKDLAPVALVNWAYSLLVVPAASPLKSVADLISAAKARPGALKYSGTNGTPPHIAGELFKRAAGVDIQHVPYKGAPASVLAVLTGDVDMTITSVGALSPHIKSGKLRALAAASPQRIAAYPELPTFVELGYPGVQVRDWQGFVAPAGTPKSVIARLHAEIAKAASMPDVKARLEALGMEPASAGPEQFAAHIHSEMQRWGKFVREVGIRAD